MIDMKKQKRCHMICVRRSHPKRSGLPPAAGVLLLDKKQGFWLVHSTPHFPPVQKEGAFSYPSSGMVKGQNFICVTYPLERFQTIGKTGGRWREKVKLFVLKGSGQKKMLIRYLQPRITV